MAAPADAVGEEGAAPMLKVNTHTRSCRSSASSAASAIAGAGCAAAADPPEALLPPRLDGLGESSGKVAAVEGQQREASSQTARWY